MLEDDSLDPALRESLMMSLRAHQDQTRDSTPEAVEAAAAPEVDVAEPLEEVEALEADLVEAEPGPVEQPSAAAPAPSRPLTRKEQVARYPLHFRLRMLKLPLLVLGGAFAGVVLLGGLLLSAYWNGLEEGLGQPGGLLVWYAALTLTSWVGARVLDRKVSFPEGTRFVCQLQTLLLPLAALAVGWVMSLQMGTGLVLGALLAGMTWYCFRQTELWITPEGGSWYSRFGLLSTGSVVAAPFLAASPASAALLATGVFLVGESSLRRVERRPLEPWHEHVLPYSLLVGPFVCVWAAVGFSSLSGGQSLAPLLLVAAFAAIWFQHRLWPRLDSRWTQGRAAQRIHWGTFLLAGLTLAVSLVDRDSMILAAGAATWVAYLTSRRLGQPLLLLPALLGSLLGHGALARRVTDFWPQADPGLFMTQAFLPYVVALAVVWAALERRRQHTEGLVAASWFLLVTVSLVVATWMMGTSLHMGFTLAGTGLAVGAAGGLMSRPLLTFLGTAALTAAAGLTLDTLGFPAAFQGTVLALAGTGLFLLGGVLQGLRRPRLQRMASSIQECAVVMTPALVAVGLGWREQPLLAGLGAPLQPLLALCLLWCTAAVSLRRADVAFLATALVAWTWHVGLSAAGHGFGSFWQVPAAGALALMPWAMEQLSLRRRFPRSRWLGALRFRHGAPLCMLALQAPVALAWPSLLGSLSVMQLAAVSGGWMALTLALVGSGRASGLRWPVWVAAVPVAAAAALPTWSMGLQVCGAVAGGALLVGFGLAFALTRRAARWDRFDPDRAAAPARERQAPAPTTSTGSRPAPVRRARQPAAAAADAVAEAAAAMPADDLGLGDLDHLGDLAELAGASGGDEADWMPFEEEGERPAPRPRPRQS